MVQQTKVAPDLLGTFRQDLLRPLRCLGIDVGQIQIWRLSPDNLTDESSDESHQSSSRFNYLNRGCFDLHRFDGPARRSTCDLDAWSHLEPPHASNLTVLERLRGFRGAALVSAAKNARKRNQPRDIVKPRGLKHHQCWQTTCDRLKGCKEHIKIQSCVMSCWSFQLNCPKNFQRCKASKEYPAAAQVRWIQPRQLLRLLQIRNQAAKSQAKPI